jgi:hypothetical protein
MALKNEIGEKRELKKERNYNNFPRGNNPLNIKDGNYYSFLPSRLVPQRFTGWG